MSQIPRPSADVSNTGVVSTGGSLYTEIDESVANDADYLTFSGGVADTCTVRLDTALDPGVYNNWVVTVRLAYESGLATGDMIMTVALYSGATLIQSTNTPALSDVITNYTINITDASSVSDYSDLRLRFTNSLASGGNLDVKLYQAFLTMDDGVVPPTPTTPVDSCPYFQDAGTSCYPGFAPQQLKGDVAQPSQSIEGVPKTIDESTSTERIYPNRWH